MPESRKGSRKKPSPASSLRTTDSIEVSAGMFKDTCLSLMDDVRENGGHVVITKYGTPVAMLVPAESASSASAFGFLRGTVIEHEDIVAPDFEAWGND